MDRAQKLLEVFFQKLAFEAFAFMYITSLARWTVKRYSGHHKLSFKINVNYLQTSGQDGGIDKVLPSSHNNIKISTKPENNHHSEPLEI